MSDIARNIQIINKKITNLNSQTQLIAVSKYRSNTEICEAITAGQTIFAENKVQEAYQKWPAIITKRPNIELHLIGHLQSNKAYDAVKLFNVIQVVDREKILHALLDAMHALNKFPSCYVQVNTGNEPQKSGIPLQDAESFINQCKKLNLPIKGLMCIPPLKANPKKHFQLLHSLASQFELPYLSMGMSKDYETAIKCGATHIRIGTEIFGPRPNI